MTSSSSDPTPPPLAEPPPIDASTSVWMVVSQKLDAFLAVWERDGAFPNIVDFLPNERGGLRRVLARELIKADMEARQVRGLSFRLEDYAAQTPEVLENDQMPLDLIFEEYHLRKRDDAKPSLDEYRSRFPSQFKPLLKLLGDSGGETTLPSRVGRQGLNRISAGQTIGDVDLLVELGQGAFAKVFSARQRSMQRVVAVKISAATGAEPQLLAQLDHPNIVRVFDQRAMPEERLRLLLMELAPGGTLAAVTAAVRATPADRRTGKLLVDAIDVAAPTAGQSVDLRARWRKRMLADPWSIVVAKIGERLARGLHYAHSRKVFHRDIKPANILLSSDGSPKLADFNVGCGSEVEGADPASMFGGSCAYMPIEQLEVFGQIGGRTAEDLDARSDLFSLAVTLLETLHGRRPFPDEVFLPVGKPTLLQDLIEQRRAIQLTPELLIPARDATTRRLHTTLKRALDPDRARRQADLNELAEDLKLARDEVAWRIFRDRDAAWRESALRSPLVWALALNLLPNVLAAVFNYNFNYLTLIAPNSERVRDAFHAAQLVINGATFPIGVVVGVAYAWPFFSASVAMARGQTLDEETAALARRRCLGMGHTVAAVGVALWTLSGFSFPLAMRWGGVSLPWTDVSQFVLSLLACGLIAGAFPFLSSTALGLWAYYPRLLGNRTPGPGERAWIAQLPAHSYAALGFAAVVPLAAVLIVLMVDRDAQAAARTLTLWMVAASLAGLAGAIWLNGRVREAAAAILRATSQEDDED